MPKNPSTSQPDLIPIHAAAELLGVSIDTIRRWEKQGKITAERSNGGHRLFSSKALQDYLDSRPLSVSEAAKHLGVSISTLRRREKQGMIAPEMNTNGRRAYTKKNLRHYELIKQSKLLAEEVKQEPSPVSFAQTHVAPLVKPKKIKAHLKQVQPIYFWHYASSAALVAVIVASLAGAAITARLSSNMKKAASHPSATVPLSNGLSVSNQGIAGHVLGLAKEDVNEYFEVNVPAFFNDKLVVPQVEISQSLKIEGEVQAQGVDVDLGDGTIKASNLVYSLQGEKGDLSLLAGDGIAINGLTIANVDKASDLAVFQNVKSGNKTLKPGQPGDTITVAAGNNVTITANEKTNTLTISSEATGDISSGHTFTGDVTATLSDSGSTVLTIVGDSVALTTDTTGNYVATIADAGNSTVAVTNGTAEGGAVTLDVVDVNCIDCLNATEIEDIYLLNTGDTMAGDFSPESGGLYDLGTSSLAWRELYVSTINASELVANGATQFNGIRYYWPAVDGLEEQLLSTNGAGGLSWVSVNAVIGDLSAVGDCESGPCFTGTSGTHLVFNDSDGDGTLGMADLTGTRTWTLPDVSGTIILSGHTFSGDVTATLDTDGSTALTIAGNAVALGTDTTGNYVATIADAGNSTVTVSGSGVENAAVTLDVVDVHCTNCLNATEIEDIYILNTGDSMAGNFLPGTAIAYDLGAAGAEWREIYADTVNTTELVNTGSITLRGIKYLFPGADGSNDFVLTTNGAGNLAWQDVTAVGGAGDITAVGSMTSGAAFAGAAASGNWLGLGSAAGRIAFDDQATDFVNILNANVGIGTTAPTSLLHVAGQCVTKDTRLRRRRRKKCPKHRHKPDSSCPDCYFYEETIITQIKPGDEILSLNEKTGEFVPAFVNALKPMPVQDSYIVYTQSGKSIRTTAEHPYLITRPLPKGKLRYSSTTFEVDQSGRLEDTGDDSVVAIANKNQAVTISLDKKTKQDIARRLYSGKWKRRRLGPDLLAALICEAITKSGLLVTALVIDLEYEEYERHITRLINAVYPQLITYFKSIGRSRSYAHSAAWSAKTRKKPAFASSSLKAMSSSDLSGSLDARSFSPRNGYRTVQTDRAYNPSLPQPLYLSRRKNDMPAGRSSKSEGWSSEHEWILAKSLKPGMRLATVNGWEPIVNVYRIGTREKMYDIEIEGTRNFVGNDIVAHNTYLGGAVSVAGNTTPETSSTYELGSADLRWDALYVGSINAEGNIIAAAGSTYDLGASGTEWREIYADTVNTTELVNTGSLTLRGIKYLFPNADGSNDYVLTTNGAGNLAWQDVTSVGGAGDITAVGSMTSGAAFAGAAASGHWLGLGSGAGRIAFDDQATDYVNILNANIGIGTAAPSAFRLQVAGNIGPDADSTYELGSAAARWDALYVGSINAEGNIIAASDSLYNLGSASLYWANAYIDTVLASAAVGINQTDPSGLLHIGSSDFFVGADGKVGIGTITPGNALHIVSTANPQLKIAYDADSYLTIGHDGSNVVIATDTEGDLYLFDGDQLGENFEVRVYGYITATSGASFAALNLDDTNDEFLIDVSDGDGSTTLDAAIRLDDNAGSSVFRIRDSDSAEVFRVDSDGHVGINTTAPASFALQVAGNVGPNADSTYELGSSVLRWDALYVGSINAEGHINPSVDSTYNLGSSSLYWANSYIDTVLASAAVGIGVTDPDSSLEIVSTGTLKIPASTGPTLVTAGQIAIDTTADQLQFFGASAKRVITYKETESKTVEYPSDSDNFNLFKAPHAITVTDIDCLVDPADTDESVVIDVQERDGTGDNPASVDATITCDNDGAADDGSLSNGSIDAGDWVSLDIGTITGDVTQLTVTVTYTVDAQ